MTRKQLVSGLRVLREDDEIVEIKTNKKTGAVEVNYLRWRAPNFSFERIPGQLILSYATEQRLQTKPK